MRGTEDEMLDEFLIISSSIVSCSLDNSPNCVVLLKLVVADPNPHNIDGELRGYSVLLLSCLVVSLPMPSRTLYKC